MKPILGLVLPIVVAFMAIVFLDRVVGAFRRRRATLRPALLPRAPLVRAAFEAGIDRMQKTARGHRQSLAMNGWWSELGPLTPAERDDIREALREAARLPNETLDAIVRRAGAAVEGGIGEGAL
jgi:hypothetical protein